MVFFEKVYILLFMVKVPDASAEVNIVLINYFMPIQYCCHCSSTSIVNVLTQSLLQNSFFRKETKLKLYLLKATIISKKNKTEWK